MATGGSGLFLNAPPEPGLHAGLRTALPVSPFQSRRWGRREARRFAQGHTANDCRPQDSASASPLSVGIAAPDVSGWTLPGARRGSAWGMLLLPSQPRAAGAGHWAPGGLCSARAAWRAVWRGGFAEAGLPSVCSGPSGLTSAGDLRELGQGGCWAPGVSPPP